MNSIGSLQGKTVLFLQGPMGDFFKRIDSTFRQRGAKTYKIGFNMGDQLFSHRDNYIPYKEPPKQWESFITRFLTENKVDKIFLFGDCRFYQRIARKAADKLGIDVFVFEEGYLRPHYITMEKFGVNGFSQLSRDPDFYRQLPFEEVPEPIHAQQSKTKMVTSATLYYALSNLFYQKYPQYIHHRAFSAIDEFFFGIRGAFRKLLYAFTERPYHDKIKQLSKQYFFVPLQTHNDFQILQHSNYRSIEKFIIEVLESFSNHAPQNTYLIFKHHPVDRGRKNYNSFIQEQSKLLGIEERVLSFHDVYLPSCLNHARATVTVNSTVGLTSIAYNIPTLTMGDAVYNIEGLTNKGVELDDFWTHYREPDHALYEKYRQFLIQTTQLNGSFYGMMPEELS